VKCDSSDEAQCAGAIGEGADRTNSALDLTVKSLDPGGGADALPVLFAEREVTNGLVARGDAR